MNEVVLNFRAITSDFKISDQEINKYLGWGKGDLQLALNYYYRKKDKEPKNTSSGSFNLNTSDAFSKMKNASIKQNKTEQFIKQVRQEYKLPIKRATQSKQSQRNSKPIDEDEMLLQEDSQFAQADYLPEAFGLHNKSAGLKQERERISLKMQIKQQSQKKQFHQQNMEGNSMQFNEIEEKQSQLISKSKTKSLPKISFSGKKDEQKDNQNYNTFEYKKQNESSQFGWNECQSEVFIGSCIISGFAIKFENNLNIPQGSYIQFKYFIEQEKKKKGFKSKKIDKSMNIRLLYKGSQLGRLKDQQAKIFVPLIVHGMIRLQLYCHFIPHRIDYYTALKLNARVHLLKRAITDPVVQTFEGHSNMIVSTYKPVADEILAIFQLLQVKIKRLPLIKRKSKLKTRSNQLHSFNKQQNKIEQDQTEKSKQLQREQRMRNDPFFKTTQRNLTDLLKFTSKQEKSNSVIEPKETESGLKKKVLQYKNIDEDKCSQLVDLYQEDLQPYKPSNNFISSLYNYQALALAWMIQRQGEKSVKNDKDQLHPLWTEYSIGSNRSLFVNQLTSQLSLKSPFSKSKCLGGILADEMGLGKTVMMAALVATHRQTKRQKREGGNLVVVPLTLLSQWYSQIDRHTKGLKTLIYYAQDRKKYENQLQKFDVVITTYGTTSHQYSKGMHVSKLGLYRLKWQRIILDQAHYIKGRIIQTAKAVYEIQGSFRWCLTGTPIQNGLGDLFSLIHFIRYSPWSEWQCWKKYILNPAENGQEDVYEVLKTILRRVFLRRTKQSKDHDGNCIVDLPPRTSKIELLQMNKAEAQYYNNLYDSSKKKIEQLQHLGILQTKYMQVLQLLMRLRQICCHPILYKSIPKYTTNLNQFQRELRRFINKKAAEYTSQNQQRYFEPLLQGEEQQRVQVSGNASMVSQSFLKDTLNKIQNKQIQNCVICLNEVQDPVITPCLHIFCKICAIRQIQQCAICSACRRRLSRDDILPLPRENRFNKNLDQEFFMSSKLLALVEHLRKLKHDDKVVVFSQFLGMLDLIEHQLKIEKLVYVRMEGSTSHKQRTKIVEKFQKDPSVQIFIVSLKTAGVGLNLVAANKVFLVDPWWNPGVEQQAIERVHRIGQKRSVDIIRLIMDQSIQLRMLQLNTDKKVLSQKVLSKQANPSESKVEKLKYLMTKY